MPNRTHYTEEPSRLVITSRAAYARVHGSGFVTRDMLEHAVEDLRRCVHESSTGHDAVLVDLRAVVGYESACLLTARQFLRDAPSLGLRRIALVASSSVLHTGSRLAAHGTSVELHTFHHELSAMQWLQPPGVVARPRSPSSEAMAAP